MLTYSLPFYGYFLSIHLLTQTQTVPSLPTKNNPAPRTQDFAARIHIAMGMPATASTDPQNREAFLLVRRQFVASYNDKTRTPNWVSWHINRDSLPKNGSFRRQEFFSIDPLLPRSFVKVEHFDYHQKYGFDRGHLCPAADRSLSEEDNRTTFLTTNIVPQSPNNNQLAWERFERACRDWAKQGNEVFIVAGPFGKGGEGSSGKATTIGRTNVQVPSHTWKVVLLLPGGKTSPKDVTPQTRTYAIVTPNNQSVTENWQRYETDVAQVEKLTGLTFFSQVDPAISKEIKTRSKFSTVPANRKDGPESKKSAKDGSSDALKGGLGS